MKPADAATLLQGVLAGFTIPLGVAGYLDEAVRLLFAAYALDALDGWLARRYGSSPDGFMLDRAFDRLSQVVAPATLLLLWLGGQGLLRGVNLALYSIYFSGLVATAFWRLVRRGVRSLAYFSGLPLFAHAVAALSSIVSGRPPHPLVLLALLAASAAPVPYFRRPRGRGSPSPALGPRLAVLAALALLPYDAEPVRVLARLLYWLVVAYAALGPIPALAGLAPSPWREGSQ
ncbi:CDP-alcohol phosphatidyltransferase family protein [Stetteria hydrogenophila]